MTQDKSNKKNYKTIANPQKGKFKKYPRPTQGTALMSNNSFYPWKKSEKKGDVVSTVTSTCDNDRSSLVPISKTFPSLRTADAFPNVASLPPKNSYFSEGEKRRPEMRLLFAG